MNPGCRVQDQLNASKPTTPYIIGRELNLRKLPGRQWESNPQPSKQLRLMTIKTSTSTETATTAYYYYCNSLYHGLPITQIKRLQHIQNGLALAVTRTLKHSHISPVLKSLHWLKVEQQIQYKIISITHKLLHITEPKYLHRLINIKPPSRTRSSDHLCLSLPPVFIRFKCANRSPRISSPRVWNSLPINLRSFAPDTHHSTTVISSIPSHPCRVLSLSRNQFLSCLKTHLFTLSCAT